MKRVRVTAGSLHELVGFLAGGDAARLGEHPRYRDPIQRHGIRRSHDSLLAPRSETAISQYLS